MNNNLSTISPKIVFKYFNEHLAEEHSFLKKETVKECIKFLECLKDIEERHDENERVEIYSNLSKTIIDMWGMMMRDALKVLNESDGINDRDLMRGISRLKQYLESFKEFEMLLYGANKWYRDTVYHQIWFYFVGEYFFSKYGIMDDLITQKDWYSDPRNKATKEIKKTRYAFFCVLALCHDLGKPLQKLHEINDSIKNMIKNYQFLHFTPFKVEFPLTYGRMLNYLVEKLSNSVKPFREKGKSLTIKSKEEIMNEVRDKTLFIKTEGEMKKVPHLEALYSTALSELDHGMLSCLLLMESFRRFKEEDTKKKEGEFWIQKSYLTSSEILKTIAKHNVKNIMIFEIGIPYFWACLVDDLIEGYRPTRAGKDFISSSLCEVQIINASLKKIQVRYRFNKKMGNKDKKEIKDIIRFFIEKLDRYYHLIEFYDFKIIIEVVFKVKDSKNQINTILMQFIHDRSKDEVCRRVFYKINEIKIEFEEDGKIKDRDEETYIEDLFMNGLEKGQKQIYKELFKDKKNPIFLDK